MNKLSFPKGSLKFTKISLATQEIEKHPNWKKSLKDYTTRRKFVSSMEENYAGQKGIDETKLPPEILSTLLQSKKALKADRQMFKTIPEFTIPGNYKISFKHPKWHPIVGVIEIESKRANVKDALKQIADKFKAAKDVHRKFRMREKVHRHKAFKVDIKYNVSGGIIHMPEVKEGVYIKFLKDQEKRIVFTPKSPKDNTNYVGVELEFMCDFNQEKLGFMLFDAGVGKQVTVASDGSLRCCEDRQPGNCSEHSNKFLHEVCILLKENDYEDTMKKVCKVLAKSNAVVNKSCGMHVHIDMRTRDADRAYQNLVSAQNILFKMNPKSRTERYAKKITERDLNIAKRSGERYHGINPIALNKHNTIEIRVHSGTIDYTKITNWIAILLKIANHSERIVKNYVSMNSFCEDFSINGMLKDYMKERIDKFKPKKEGEAEPEAERGVA